MTRSKRNNHQPSKLFVMKEEGEVRREKSFQPPRRIDQEDRPHGCKFGRQGDAAHIGKDIDLLFYLVIACARIT